MSVTVNPAVENPRWTLCRAALGAEPLAVDFLEWNEGMWSRYLATFCFHLKHRRRMEVRDLELAFGVLEAHTMYNTWLLATVEAELARKEGGV